LSEVQIFQNVALRPLPPGIPVLSRLSARHTATLLPNGKVLIAGGRSHDSDSTDTTPTAELYDPATGSFSLTGSSAYSDYLFPVAASLLTNGKVLATLEYSCDPAELAELYDASTESFVATGKMTTFRCCSTATLLPEGRVLIASGENENYPQIAEFPSDSNSAELYDPVTGTFSTSPSMVTQSQAGHAATLLPDGTVLLSGGWVCCIGQGPFRSAHPTAGAEIMERLLPLTAFPISEASRTCSRPLDLDTAPGRALSRQRHSPSSNAQFECATVRASETCQGLNLRLRNIAEKFIVNIRDLIAVCGSVHCNDSSV
jgi:hypothetical protein